MTSGAEGRGRWRGRSTPASSADYFTDPGFRRLLERCWKRYESLGRIGGKAVLEHAAPEECDAVNRFFGWDCRPGERVEVRLELFDRELRESRFGIGLLELHEVIYGEPLLTKRERLQDRDAEWRELFLSALDRIGEPLPPTVRGWVARVEEGSAAGTRTLRETWKSKPEQAIEAFVFAVRALSIVFRDSPDGLVASIRLPVLAAAVSGDAHALDRNRACGRLFLSCLLDLAAVSEAAEEEGSEEDGAATLRLRDVYRRFGILDDDLSSVVRFYIPDDNCDSLPLPTVWSLREVEASSSMHSFTAIYAVENPAVFSTVLDALQAGLPAGPGRPALVCTSGPASAAAIRWLRRCLEGSGPAVNLYYSGDFDVNGLAMGQTLANLFPDRFRPWRFCSTDYHSAVQRLPGPVLEEDERERLGKMLLTWDAALGQAVCGVGRKVHQEAFVTLLKEDYLAAFSARD